MTTPILHLAPKDRWQQTLARFAVDPDATYHDPSLDGEGFIHCSTADQILVPANERFAGRTDLVALVIDPTQVGVPVVFEDCYETGMAFPHIYGPLPVTAVVDVVPFPCRPDGSFELPAGLA